MSRPPLIILGSPRSFTSLICALIGQHPAAYGVPELNLFIADTLADMLQKLGGYRQIQLHGLMRTVGQLYGGEQTIASMEMARRWIVARLDRTTGDVYRELCDKVAPCIVVDKSPIYALNGEYLANIARTFPDASFLHLVRHPYTQANSILGAAHGAMAALTDSYDYECDPPVLDPQIGWVRAQRNILDFLESIRPERQLRMRGEDILDNPTQELAKIGRWLGIDSGSKAIDRMMRPEQSPYACLGPVGAHLGNDINFLRSPVLRPGKVARGRLDVPLPWRSDSKGFSPETRAMALRFGYH